MADALLRLWINSFRSYTR